MKFILVVLGIKFLASVLTKNKITGEHESGMMETDVRHPAEFILR